MICSCINCFNLQRRREVIASGDLDLPPDDDGRPYPWVIELTQDQFPRGCEKCGHRRCPHHSDHRNACTRSNAPGQPGSIFVMDLLLPEQRKTNVSPA
jgi:hypothetical protein